MDNHGVGGGKKILLVCRRRDLSPRPFDYESNALTKLSYPGKLSVAFSN